MSEMNRNRRRMMNAQFDPIIKIKVIGVGGGGCNAIEGMVRDGVRGVDFIAANTDLQQLQSQTVDTLLLGENVTKGLGAGGNPEVGEEAALDTLDEIRAKLNGANMVFIAVGLGGGTGTGAAPVIARVAKEEVGCLTIAVATLPFEFERGRIDIAYEGLQQLKKECDGVVIISNQKISEVLGNVPMIEGFKEADSNLRRFVQSVSDIISKVAHINIDFADIKSVLENSGVVLFGIATEEIDDIEEDVEMLVAKTLDNPLLLSDIRNARGVIVNITHAPDIVTNVHQSILDVVEKRISQSKDTRFFWGVSINEKLGPSQVILTIIGSNFNDEEIDLGDGEHTISAGPIEDSSDYETVDETVDRSINSGYREPRVIFDEDEIFGTTSISKKSSFSHTFNKKRSKSGSTRSPLKKPSLFKQSKRKKTNKKSGSFWWNK